MDKQETSEAFKILKQPEEFKNLRSGPAFINKLAQDPPFLKDLLDICFRPNYFAETRKVVLGPKQPALAIDALTSLYEQLINLLAYDHIVPKDLELQDYQMQQNGSDGEEENEEFIYLKFIHQAFGDPEREDASMSNLSRVLGPLYYQSPDKIMRFYEQESQSKDLLLNALWKRNVIEIFCKLLEAESGKQFYLEYKIRHLQAFYSLLEEGLGSDHRHEWMESLLYLHRFIMEKMEERYDGNKYVKLLQTMNSGDQQILEKLLKAVEQLSERTVLVCMRWCEECLKKDSCIWAASDLRMPVTNLSRKYSMSNSFYEEQTGKKKVYHICAGLLQLIQKFMTQVQARLSESRFPFPCVLHWISWFKGLYFWVKIVSTSTQNGVASRRAAFHANINEALLQDCFKIAQKYPNSTPLHNYIKQLIIELINLNLIPRFYFCLSDNPYLQTLRRWLPRQPNSSKVPFGPQTYHIYHELLKLDPEFPSDITGLLLGQKLRRETAIGGCDPRKLHDNLRGSSAFSEQSEEVIEIDIPSLKSNTSSGHNFQLTSSSNSLRLSNALSIEKRISEEGEEGETSQS